MSIERIGVIGAGQMGSGIAQVAAMAGFHVTIVDNHGDSLKRGEQRVRQSLEKFVAKGVIKDKEEAISRIHWCYDLEKLQYADLVIEAIVENEDLKKALFRTLDATLKTEAIIATNTSSISITRLAQSTTRPDKFIGMHFMNPVPVMKLIEIIMGHHTSKETLAVIEEVSRKMGKTTTLAKDYPGFIANRVLMPMINEAFFALMENVSSAHDIDVTMKLGCNFPMGPLALADLIGLDTCLSIMEVLHLGLGDDKYRPCPLLRKYVEAGLLGQKTSQGIFSYPSK